MQPLLRLQEQARLKALEAEASAKRKVLAGKRDRARQLVDELKNMNAVSDAMREKLKRPSLQVTAGRPRGWVWKDTARLLDASGPIFQATLSATAGLVCLVLSLCDLHKHWCHPAWCLS